MLKANNLQQNITEINTSKIDTLNNNALCAEQK